MIPLDFSGEFGGLLATAFGFGCAAGWSFSRLVLSRQVERVFNQKFAHLTERADQFEKRAKIAEAHVDKCERELTELRIEIAVLKSGQATLQLDVDAIKALNLELAKQRAYEEPERYIKSLPQLPPPGAAHAENRHANENPPGLIEKALDRIDDIFFPNAKRDADDGRS